MTSEALAHWERSHNISNACFDILKRLGIGPVNIPFKLVAFVVLTNSKTPFPFKTAGSMWGRPLIQKHDDDVEVGEYKVQGIVE